jgi:hypothetical protein
MTTTRIYPLWTEDEDTLLTALRLDGTLFADIAPRISALGTKRSTKAVHNRWRQIRPDQTSPLALSTEDYITKLALHRPWR